MKYIIFLLLIFFNLGAIISQNDVGEIDANFQKMLERKYNKDFPTISPISAQEKINSETIFLDTRSKEEYEVSHLPNAVFIDYDNFNLDKIEHIEKNSEVVVYCSIGVRSQNIGEKLKKAGYINVKNLYGGIFLWANQSRQMINLDQEQVEKVHGFNKFWGRWVDEDIVVY